MLGGLSVGFEIVFAVAVAAMVSLFALLVLSLVRSVRILRRAKLDPLAVPATLAARYASGSGDGLGARLAELDDLAERGVITAAERGAGRARLLGGA